jgi:prepilin-type N-terminal cleavage/methylation domain-containing protein
MVVSGNRTQRGFSLTELIIAIAISAIVIMMCSDAFTIILTQSRQQTRVVDSEMESIIGLRMLRYDIEHAGFGLPWEFPTAIAYQEAASAPASTYNDAPAQVPRAVLTGNGVGYNGSDRLVVKSTAAGTSDTAQMWTYILTGGTPKVWGSAKLDLAAGDRVIVIKPQSDVTSKNQLITGAAFFTQFNLAFPAAFSPQNTSERFVIYGVDPDTDLRMPFNRVDYYVSRPAGMSPSCAPNTGILYKATVSHSDGTLNEIPIIDCVADMQVIFRRDTDGDGVPDVQSNDITALSAQQIREGIKEVRIYVLAQEGQRDVNYRHTPSVITVGESGLGSAFDLATTIGTGWQNYRWKVYTLVVKPKQLQ